MERSRIDVKNLCATRTSAIKNIEINKVKSIYKFQQALNLRIYVYNYK